MSLYINARLLSFTEGEKPKILLFSYAIPADSLCIPRLHLFACWRHDTIFFFFGGGGGGGCIAAWNGSSMDAAAAHEKWQGDRSLWSNDPLVPHNFLLLPD